MSIWYENRIALSVVKPCKQLMKNSSLIESVDTIVKDVSRHNESVLTVFTRISTALRRGWKYLQDIQIIESDYTRAFGEAPKRPSPPLPFRVK